MRDLTILGVHISDQEFRKKNWKPICSLLLTGLPRNTPHPSFAFLNVATIYVLTMSPGSRFYVYNPVDNGMWPNQKQISFLYKISLTPTCVGDHVLPKRTFRLRPDRRIKVLRVSTRSSQFPFLSNEKRFSSHVFPPSKANGDLVEGRKSSTHAVFLL